MEDPNAVETPVVTAADDGVKPETSPAPEVDPEVTILALKERAEKAESDRDNYRAGLLALKGKKGTEELDLSDPNQLQAYIDKSVQEQLANTTVHTAKAAFEAEALKTARELREARLALQSKRASTAIAGGAGSGAGHNPASEVKTSYWSPEQIAALKGKGLTDAQIERAGELARTGTATGPNSGPGKR